jgi:hypothetical protein
MPLKPPRMSQEASVLIHLIPDWLAHLVFLAAFLVASRMFYVEMKRGRKAKR